MEYIVNCGGLLPRLSHHSRTNFHRPSFMTMLDGSPGLGGSLYASIVYSGS